MAKKDEYKAYLVVGDGETYVLSARGMTKKQMREYITDDSAKMTLMEGAWMWDEVRASSIPVYSVTEDDDEDFEE